MRIVVFRVYIFLFISVFLAQLHANASEVQVPCVGLTRTWDFDSKSMRCVEKYLSCNGTGSSGKFQTLEQCKSANLDPALDCRHAEEEYKKIIDEIQTYKNACKSDEGCVLLSYPTKSCGHRIPVSTLQVGEERGNRIRRLEKHCPEEVAFRPVCEFAQFSSAVCINGKCIGK